MSLLVSQDDQELSSSDYATTRAVADGAELGLTHGFLYKECYKTHLS